MIPIKQIGDLTEYKTFIASLKKTLTGVIKKGYVGNRGRQTKSDIMRYHETLSPALQSKYLASVDTGYHSLESLRSATVTTDLLAPKEMISDKTLSLLTDLNKELDNLAVTKDFDKYIKTFQKRFPIDKEGEIDTKSNQYKSVYHIFVTIGYEDTNFKSTVWKVTNLRVCPYCNRTYIPLINWDDKDGMIKGQLDHFYPKEKYPYLAMCLYNLVPSCTYCNGNSCKGTEDPYVRNIVSPFNLESHDGLRFRIIDITEGLEDIDKAAESFRIGIDTTKNPKMNNNALVFHLQEIYSFHRDIAADIIYKYKATMEKPYQNFVQEVLGATPSKATIKNFLKLFWGVPLDEDKLGDRPMSKFTLDLINDLEEKNAPTLSTYTGQTNRQ